MTLEQYRTARSLHLKALLVLHDSRRSDGSYPHKEGLRVSKIQIHLHTIRQLRLGRTRWTDGTWHDRPDF